jgi:hypothetical protein
VRPRYFDRQGNPLQLLEWASMLEANPELRIVEQTAMPDGKWISTVWIGINHRFLGEGPPLIFETMVFPSQADMGELECRRYATEPEARAGHAELVARYGGGH